MKKLRLAKERENNQDVDNDLRGLGNTTLFGDLTPEPVLSLVGASHDLLPIAKDLSIEKNSAARSTDQTHYVCTKKNLSHKEKTINLFIYALMLKVTQNTNSHLWEENKFYQALQAGLEIEPSEVHHPDILSKGHEAVTISPTTQLYLKQAGFSMAATDKNLVISHSEAKELLEQVIKRTNSTSTLTKVS